jgi:hypothetical protein
MDAKENNIMIPIGCKNKARAIENFVSIWNRNQDDREGM